MSKLTGEHTYIYALCDPESGDIRYIGKADNPHKRLKQHLARREPKPTHKTHWVQAVLESGRRPLLRILEQVPADEWKDRERQWIALCNAQGANLTNTTEGGIGGATLTAESLSPAERERRRRHGRQWMNAMWAEARAWRDATPEQQRDWENFYTGATT